MSLEQEQLTVKEQFEAVIKTEDKLQIRDFLNDQNIADVADLVYEFPEYESSIIANMSMHRATSVFKILELPTQKKIIKALPPNTVAALMNDLPADDRTDFLEELPSNAVRELIKLLDPEERKVTLSLLGYPENSIGRLMTPDYVYVYPHNTIEEVFSTIRKHGKDSETINVIYVINQKGELLDDIRIRDFILNPPDKKVSELMDDRVVSLQPDDDQETASEEFSEDMQKMGGTAALEEPYIEMPIFRLFKKRIIWLIILFFGELATIAAMQQFQDEIAKVVILATFIPLIISSGGNSGSQASTLIIQAMALGELTITDWWRIMRREIFSGLLLGLTLCLIGISVISVWHLLTPDTFGAHYLRIAFTVGFSLIGIVLWGSLMGSMLPLLLKRLGADPAASSTPFVATLVDVTGLLIYFSVAFLFLKGTLL